MLFLKSIRDFIISNFGIKIYSIVSGKSNNIYLIKSIFRYSLIFFPFSIIKNIQLPFRIIYKKDNIYFITNTNENKITPIILNFTYFNDRHKVNMLKEIKYYNSSIPLLFFIYNNNLINYPFLNIKYFNKGQSLEKNICLNSNNNILIYELFQELL